MNIYNYCKKNIKPFIQEPDRKKFTMKQEQEIKNYFRDTLYEIKKNIMQR